MKPNAIQVPNFPISFPKIRRSAPFIAAFFLFFIDAGAHRVSAQPTPFAQEKGFVYTADQRANSISMIDLSTGMVKSARLPISPHNVQVSHDGRLLLIVGMPAGVDMSEDKSGMAMPSKKAMPRGRLLILNATTMSIANLIDIEVGSEPAHVIIDQLGKLAYVTNKGDNTVSVVNVAQRKITARIETGKSPHGLRMSPNGREIYVANNGSDTVSVIDVTGAREVARVKVGKAPAQVGFAPDGKRLYVSSTTDNTVVVVDTAQRKQIASVPVGRTPIQVFVTPNGRYVYAANEGSATNPDNTASVIDTATNKVIATIVTGKGAHGVAIADDGSRAFISNTIDNTVSIINTTTRQVTRSIKVGEGSGGISFKGAASQKRSS